MESSRVVSAARSNCSSRIVFALVMTVLIGVSQNSSAFARQTSVQTPTDLSFKLPSTDGQMIELSPKLASQNPGWSVVCFLGIECPMVRLYFKRLNEISNRFQKQGVQFIGINSNQQDSIQELAEFKEELGVAFPLVKDKGNQVADRYGAERTPEVFVLNRELQVMYRGRIDDQYEPGVSRNRPTVHYLQTALQELLAGKQVTTPNTEPTGCLIGREKIVSPNDSTVTFTNQISRLIQRHCLECHRAGEIGPFAMEEYDEVKGWAEMIVEVLDNGRMPPWHAMAQERKFENERFMSEAEKQVFRDWLKQGTPFGDASELPASPPPSIGWRLPRQPDRILAMSEKPFSIPAEGTVEYQYFVVDPGFTEDTWITAAEIVPGNRSVVHHSIVFVRPPDGVEFKGIGWLTAYVPGQGKPIYRDNFARRVPAGSKLVFQQHYTPTGAPESDITRIGLIFGDPQKITHEVFTLTSMDQQFEIPPQDAAFQVATRRSRFPRNGELISFAPHMHYRGKSFQLHCRINGQDEQLVNVPRYDFNWQHSYQLSEPLPLSQVERFDCKFVFDNSANNPFNPDPNQTVTWGDQTWEEMAIAFFEMSQPREADGSKALTRYSQSKKKSINDDERQRRVATYFSKHDRNGDDQLAPEEVPKSVRRFKFNQCDLDGDGFVSKDELSRQLGSAPE